jgi:hypothetical protein
MTHPNPVITGLAQMVPAKCFQRGQDLVPVATGCTTRTKTLRHDRVLRQGKSIFAAVAAFLVVRRGGNWVPVLQRWPWSTPLC